MDTESGLCLSCFLYIYFSLFFFYFNVIIAVTSLIVSISWNSSGGDNGKGGDW